MEVIKETAVEWLIKELEKNYDTTIFIKALELEKQQIIEFGEKMQIIKDVDFDGNVTFIFEPKTHFKETYGKDNK